MNEFREVFSSAGLKYNSAGLITVIAVDQSVMATKGLESVLMLAWANSEAVDSTLESGKATYWSRSRQELWVKGTTSGNTQRVAGVYADCDRDCLIYDVKADGPACHNGSQSCFQLTEEEWLDADGDGGFAH